MTVVRAQLAAAFAAAAVAMPFLAIANASGSASHQSHESPVVVGRQSRTSGVGVAGGSVYVWSTDFDSKPIAKRVDKGGACTLGFAVRASSGRVGSLTAGHCVATLSGGPSYAVHQTTNIGASHTDPGVLLGKVARGGYRMGKNGDSAVELTASGRSARPFVFIGGTKSKLTIPVVGMRKPSYGMHVCYSGAASGEHCGYRIVGMPRTEPFQEPNGGPTYKIGHEWGAKSGKCSSRAGDSGSPVYTVSDNQAYAVGVLSGAITNGKCEMFFTPVSLALQQLDLTLVRAKS